MCTSKTSHAGMQAIFMCAIHKVILQNMRIALAISSIWLTLACVAPAAAQTFTDPAFNTELVATVPAFSPVGLAWAPDGRLFIWQKNGIVRIVKNGTLLPTPFL